MENEMSKILIFGGPGYLGKYMVKASVSMGYKTYDRLSHAYTQLKEQQRVEYAQLKEQHGGQSKEQRAAYEQLREMVMNMARGGTCAPNPFWSYDQQPPPLSPPPAPPLY